MDKFRAKKKVGDSRHSTWMDCILKTLPSITQVFMEPQESSTVETVLREYATEIQDLVSFVTLNLAEIGNNLISVLKYLPYLSNRVANL